MVPLGEEAYMAISGMTSSRRRVIIKKAITLFEHEKKTKFEFDTVEVEFLERR